jgi:hypothetical protein
MTGHDGAEQGGQHERNLHYKYVFLYRVIRSFF